jgi:hypothetical protein
MRPFAFVGILAMTVSLSRADDPVTLKTYYPKANDKVKVTVEEKTELKFTASGAKETKTYTTKSLTYEDEIVSVGGEKQPNKLKRYYTRAVVGIDGKNTTLKIEGARLLIVHEFGEAYKYTIENKGDSKDGRPDKESEALLDSEFARGNRESLLDVFSPSPPKKMKENDTWQLDSNELVSVLSDKKDTEFKVIKPTGQGKLLKVDKLPKADNKNPDPKQTGKFEVTITAQIASGEKAQLIKVDEGTGSLNFKYTAEGVLDGSSPQGKATAVMTLKGSGTVGGAGGNFEITITETRTTVLLPKK